MENAENGETPNNWKIHPNPKMDKNQHDIVFRCGRQGVIAFLRRFTSSHPEVEISPFVTIYFDADTDKVGFEFHGRTDDRNSYALRWQGSCAYFCSPVLMRKPILAPLESRPITYRRFRLNHEKDVNVGTANRVPNLFTVVIPKTQT